MGTWRAIWASCNLFRPPGVIDRKRLSNRLTGRYERWEAANFGASIPFDPRKIYVDRSINHVLTIHLGRSSNFLSQIWQLVGAFNGSRGLISITANRIKSLEYDLWGLDQGETRRPVWRMNSKADFVFPSRCKSFIWVRAVNKRARWVGWNVAKYEPSLWAQLLKAAGAFVSDFEAWYGHLISPTKDKSSR